MINVHTSQVYYPKVTWCIQFTKRAPLFDSSMAVRKFRTCLYKLKKEWLKTEIIGTLLWYCSRHSLESWRLGSLIPFFITTIVISLNRCNLPLRNCIGKCWLLVNIVSSNMIITLTIKVCIPPVGYWPLHCRFTTSKWYCISFEICTLLVLYYSLGV